jgi:disulfide bond formation protein DsbB
MMNSTRKRHEHPIRAAGMRHVAGTLLIAAGLVVAGCNSGSGGATPEAPDGPTSESGSAGDAGHGKELFTACAACHGPEGKGMPNLGKDFTASTFVAEKTDAELVEFLKVGRPVDDPLNTTGVMMPPKGGNPALTDQDLVDIVAFVRTLNTVD